jgi:hypothetical protein
MCNKKPRLYWGGGVKVLKNSNQSTTTRLGNNNANYYVVGGKLIHIYRHFMP